MRAVREAGGRSKHLQNIPENFSKSFCGRSLRRHKEKQNLSPHASRGAGTRRGEGTRREERKNGRREEARKVEETRIQTNR